MQLNTFSRSRSSGLRFLPLLAAFLQSAISVVAQPAVTDDPILAAMQDEMGRSLSQLRLENAHKPYFMLYIVRDQETFSADGSFGAIERAHRGRNRTLDVAVRVGDYAFDNSGYFNFVDFLNNMQQDKDLVTEDSYGAIRRGIWLGTDESYKSAVEMLAKKEAHVKNKVREDTIPDFSRQAVTTAIADRGAFLIDSAAWVDNVRSWSAIFRGYPRIQESEVRLRAELTNFYLVNSEGTTVRQPKMQVSIEIAAAAEAPDGVRLNHYLPFYATSVDGLPSSDSIAQSIRAMAGELTALVSAPVIDKDYVGPVLLTGQASSEMFAQIFASQLSGERPPIADEQSRSMIGGNEKSELAGRMNRLVLPRFLSVYDDPLQNKVGDRELIGSYTVDDEGVPAQRVSIVENGVLKRLVMSRRPSREITQSNGHGRTAFGEKAKASIANLFIESTEGKSDADMKAELVRICREQDLPYGIIIRSLSVPGTELGGNIREMMFSFGGGGEKQRTLSSPLLAFKVYVDDGQEELVRGVTVGEFSARSLRYIAAAGKEGYAQNRMKRGSGMMDMIPLPTSIIAPSILFEEVELGRASGTQNKPALLTNPYFEK